MTDEELVARLDHWIKQEVLVLVDSDLLPIRDRIEALTEQLNAARQDAKEAEAYAEELENEAVLSKAAYEGVSSLLLSVQQDCIKERQRAERLEAKLAECEARLGKAVEALEDVHRFGVITHPARATLAALAAFLET